MNMEKACVEEQQECCGCRMPKGRFLGQERVNDNGDEVSLKKSPEGDKSEKPKSKHENLEKSIRGWHKQLQRLR